MSLRVCKKVGKRGEEGGRGGREREEQELVKKAINQHADYNTAKLDRSRPVKNQR